MFVPGDGIGGGCTRGGRAVQFSIDGERLHETVLVSACAVAPARDGQGGWTTGGASCVRLTQAAVEALAHPALQLDNHAVAR